MFCSAHFVAAQPKAWDRSLSGHSRTGAAFRQEIRQRQRRAGPSDLAEGWRVLTSNRW
jgi:hypothetical protein